METLFPLEIPVVANGKKLQAMIFNRINDSRVSYKVRFSNGFEDIFTLAGENDDLGPIGTKDGWTEHGPCLLGDLRVLSYLNDGELIKLFTYTVNDKPTNVWVVKHHANQSAKPYDIYYNGSCQFSMALLGASNKFEITHYSDDNERIFMDMAEAVVKFLPVPVIS